MAKGIIDCKGRIINIGDRVRTGTGDVIEVCGGMVSEHRLFTSHDCVVVPHETPLTNTGHVNPTKDGKDDGGDTECIVWGT
jgi:hypothetical protein